MEKPFDIEPLKVISAFRLIDDTVRLASRFGQDSRGCEGKPYIQLVASKKRLFRELVGRQPNKAEKEYLGRIFADIEFRKSEGE